MYLILKILAETSE